MLFAGGSFSELSFSEESGVQYVQPTSISREIVCFDFRVGNTISYDLVTQRGISHDLAVQTDISYDLSVNLLIEDNLLMPTGVIYKVEI